MAENSHAIYVVQEMYKWYSLAQKAAHFIPCNDFDSREAVRSIAYYMVFACLLSIILV